MRTRRRLGRRARAALALLALLAVAAGVGLARGTHEDGGLPVPFELPDGDRGPDFDVTGFEPFEFQPHRVEELMKRGRDAYSHVVYAKSPGGVEATERRVARFQPLIDRAAERHGVSADTLGALVFLESAGRHEVMASGRPDGATGLGQILPGTAEDLLGMSVDLARSMRLTRSIERNERRARRARSSKGRRLYSRRVARARRERREVDERFDPAASLDGAARYLALAEERFGREDLAAASYHMGIGNLESVIAAYVAPRPAGRTTSETVERHELTYARLYFDSSPIRNPRTHRRLLSFGDDSRHYLFRLEAAREIRRLYRNDREELLRLAALQNAKASAEEVLRPASDNPPYEESDDLRDAYEDGELVALPDDPARLGFGLDRRMGSLAPRLDEPRELYRGLRPEALAVLLYVAKEVRKLSGGAPGALRVTSTVRDLPYQELLVRSNAQATSGFSLHTTGFAIDIALDFRSRRQERALVHVLERLRALRVIDWVYEPGAIHLTAGPDAEEYLPLYEAVAGGG